MSHITDGLLHAYLDGAMSPDLEAEWMDAEGHLETCSDCRQRLDEARDLREAASNLLASATVPAGAPPAFEDIVAASRTESSSRSGGSWLGSASRLAWAASLVLAVGAGWIGRELLVQNGQDVPALVAERVAAVAEPSEARDEVDADLMAQAEAESPARERSFGDRAVDDAPESPAEPLGESAQKLEGAALPGSDDRLDQLQARVAEESLSDDAQEARIIVVAREIMDAAHFAALISLDESGQPRARTMDPFPPEADMTVWMATNAASRKVEQIRRDPRVTVYYFDSAGLGYVSLMGEARIVDDPEEKERRWKPEWEDFYPDRESSYILIEVSPNRLEVVSEKHGLSGDPVTWTPDGLFIGSR
jgi:general stress protein 26